MQTDKACEDTKMENQSAQPLQGMFSESEASLPQDQSLHPASQEPPALMSQETCLFGPAANSQLQKEVNQQKPVSQSGIELKEGSNHSQATMNSENIEELQISPKTSSADERGSLEAGHSPASISFPEINKSAEAGKNPSEVSSERQTQNQASGEPSMREDQETESLEGTQLKRKESEQPEKSIKKPRRFIKRNKEREDQIVPLEELGKRIVEMRCQLFDKLSVPEESLTTEQNVVDEKKVGRGAKKLKLQHIRHIQSIHEAGGFLRFKEKGEDSMQPVVMKAKIGPQAFPCFKDEAIFHFPKNKQPSVSRDSSKASNSKDPSRIKTSFLNLLKNHGVDQDEDTSSEDLQRGLENNVKIMNEGLQELFQKRIRGQSGEAWFDSDKKIPSFPPEVVLKRSSSLKHSLQSEKRSEKSQKEKLKAKKSLGSQAASILSPGLQEASSPNQKSIAIKVPRVTRSRQSSRKPAHFSDKLKAQEEKLLRRKSLKRRSEKVRRSASALVSPDN